MRHGTRLFAGGSIVSLLVASLLGSLLASLLPSLAAAAERPPNFVFLLVDDLGWADVGAFGSRYHETPHIDRLAELGMRFTDGYAACPVCSPTRASILTGRHPVRVDITDWIPGMAASRIANARFQHVEDRDSLALDELTIAEALRPAGYQSFFAGKWHLGGAGELPTDQGFDFNVGGFHVGSPPGGYYSPWKNPHLKSKRDGEYLTERLTEESISFLRSRDRARPFLLYLSYYNVHTPIQPYRKRVAHFAEKAAESFEGRTPTKAERRGQSRLRQDNAAYASMVAAVDDSVGSILAELDRLKLTESTVVFFFSDNGGLCTKNKAGPTSNLPLRSGKGWLYEGGVREPMIVRAPGLTKAGSVCSTPVVSMDFFPTMMELAGLPAQPDRRVDGKSLTPLLRGERPKLARSLYWHYPHYHGSTWTPGAAIRQGDWKLIEFYEFDQVELYNLREDIGETRDLSKVQVEKTAELRRQLASWQKRLGAKMPQPK
ncbi:MAG: sulfatase [Pirellulaceae bacterium]|jgi:arylsulfatase A-like enzyme|nr:sulfatase [Pirellulaceae bacterium]MDP7015968.1 sulfatase [Pirellulaceae bacterium]